MDRRETALPPCWPAVAAVPGAGLLSKERAQVQAVARDHPVVLGREEAQRDRVVHEPFDVAPHEMDDRRCEGAGVEGIDLGAEPKVDEH